jgi:DNA-binding HxlR family transcriptional regulator
MLDNDSSYVPDSSLGQWDTNVLDLIGEEGLTRFTFDGLKRRLGVHSETLSRVMDRLEEQELVERQTDGYRITPKARELLRAQPLSEKESKVPLLQTLLPPEIPLKQVVSELAGRWFGTLRWLGYAENGEGIVLKWITDDGGIQVDAVFLDGSLSIDAKLLSEKSLNAALMASYQLIGHISRIYSKPGRVKPVAWFAYFGTPVTLEWL